MTAHWYVLRSKPNKEQFLSEQLEAHQVETFYPRLRAHPVNPRARKIKPYFPGYLFIRVDLDKDALSALQWIPGAVGFVSFDNAPSMASDELIRAIQKRVEQINAAGRELFEDLKKGDAVVIQGGAFAGYEAIFDAKISGSERVRVLLSLMQGRAAKMEISAGLLAKKEKRK